MDALTTVTEAATAIKTIADMVAGIRSRKGREPETEKVLQEIESRLITLKTEILNLKEKIVELKGEVVGLKEENSNLRGQISSKEERSSERKRYQRKKVGQAWVQVREDEPGALFCPACFESKQQEILLQPLSSVMNLIGSHQCPNCGVAYNCR